MSEVPLYLLSESYPSTNNVLFENNYFTEMCSDSETGSYLRLIDFVYHSTLGWRVIKKKKKKTTNVLSESRPSPL